MSSSINASTPPLNVGASSSTMTRHDHACVGRQAWRSSRILQRAVVTLLSVLSHRGVGAHTAAATHRAPPPFRSFMFEPASVVAVREPYHVQMVCPQNSACTAFIVWLCGVFRRENKTRLPTVCIPDVWPEEKDGLWASTLLT